jgi:cytochrome b561
MPRREPPPRWSGAAIALHWATVPLLAGAFVVAWAMVAVPFRLLGLKFALYQAHKTLGLLVLAAALGRLVLRARRGRPGPDAALGRGESRLAALGQAALYGLMLGVPLLGWLTAGTAPLRVPTLLFGLIPLPQGLAPDPALFGLLREVHRAGAIGLVGLAAGHAGLAWRHHRRGREVLRRMWPGRL